MTRPTIDEYHESLHQFVATVPVSLRFVSKAKEIKCVVHIAYPKILFVDTKCISFIKSIYSCNNVDNLVMGPTRQWLQLM